MTLLAHQEERLEAKTSAYVQGRGQIWPRAQAFAVLCLAGATGGVAVREVREHRAEWRCMETLGLLARDW